MEHYTDWPTYPTDILDLTDFPNHTDDVDDVLAWIVNALRAEMSAVQGELGTLPKSSFSDVNARLNAMLPHYNDRGDTATYDWTLATLTTDGTWRDLDCSLIVPVGTKGITIDILAKDNLVNTKLLLRKKGHTLATSPQVLWIQVANIWIEEPRTIACDNDRKIQYLATNTVWTSLNLTVRSWWK